MNDTLEPIYTSTGKRLATQNINDKLIQNKKESKSLFDR